SRRSSVTMNAVTMAAMVTPMEPQTIHSRRREGLFIDRGMTVSRSSRRHQPLCIRRRTGSETSAPAGRRLLEALASAGLALEPGVELGGREHLEPALHGRMADATKLRAVDLKHLAVLG